MVCIISSPSMNAYISYNFFFMKSKCLREIAAYCAKSKILRYEKICFKEAESEKTPLLVAFSDVIHFLYMS